MSGRGRSLSGMNSPAWLQRATTWLAIAGYAVLASGLPLPMGMLAPRGDAVTDTRLAAKDRSRPFPCMDKPCGCATAEQCFANCCCHTPAERLAWAKAHSVEPAVLVALERRVAADAAPTAPAGGCCAAKAKRKPSCCSDRGVLSASAVLRAGKWRRAQSATRWPAVPATAIQDRGYRASGPAWQWCAMRRGSSPGVIPPRNFCPPNRG